MTPFDWKMPPFAHQARELERARDSARGLWWEMGTAKTSATIANACVLFDAGEVDCLLVVAPNGIHVNWLSDELPKHLPDRFSGIVETVQWASDKARESAQWRAVVKAKREKAKFLVVAMTYHSVMTEMGEALLKTLLRFRKCMLVLDESARIKSAGAKWTKKLQSVARFAPYRRCLTGTPIADSPFDAFTQVRFLDPAAWLPLGITTNAAFKQYFATWKKGYGNGREYPEFVSFRNLPDLRAVLDKVGSRVLKADALDLPPQLYTKRRFEMTPAQVRTYSAIRDEFVAELARGTVTAPLAIVRLTRLQQVACGFVVDDDGNERALDDWNPRVNELLDVVDDLAGSFIVFCKFRRDVEEVAQRLHTDGVSFVRYDGGTSDADRLAARQRFQAGEVRCFLATTATAGEGLTLTRATTVIFYSVGYKLSERLQAESRAHRAGQTSSVLYVDIVATGCVDEDGKPCASCDEKIVDALRSKRDVAAEVTGDKVRAWI